MYREGPPYQRRGSLKLWQFLVTLLDDPANAHFIAWTGRGMEFKLIEPKEVSRGVSITSLLIMYRGLLTVSGAGKSLSWWGGAASCGHVRGPLVEISSPVCGSQTQVARMGSVSECLA